MIATLRQRDFALLWIGQSVSLGGNWLLFVALPFYVYGLTGSPLATGATFAASALPPLLFGSVAGVLVDRWDRRKTMVVADVLRAGILVPLLLVHSPSSVWLVYAVSILQGTVGQFFGPARNALIPVVIPDEQIPPANALDALAVQTTRLLGPPIGGALLVGTGIFGVVVLDSVTFLLSALAVSFVRPVPSTIDPAPESDQQQTSFLGSVWEETVVGLRVIRANPQVKGVFVVLGIAWLGQGIINALFVPFLSDVLHANALQYSWTETAQGVGAILGGIVLGKLDYRVGAGRYMGLGGIGCGVIFFAIINVSLALSRVGLPWLPVACALYAMVGLPVMALFLPPLAILQTAVADAVRGRVFGAIGALTTLAMVAGLGVGSLLTPLTNSALLLDSAGVLYALAGFAALVLIPVEKVAITGRGRVSGAEESRS